jgi:hypothetical protein
MQLIIGQGYDIDETNAGDFGRLGAVVALFLLNFQLCLPAEIRVLILNSSFQNQQCEGPHSVGSLIF